MKKSAKVSTTAILKSRFARRAMSAIVAALLAAPMSARADFGDAHAPPASILLAQNNQPTQTPDGQEKGKTALTGGPRRQLATIIFAGLGGMVLGLSTLSFYGRPQDYLPNVAYGLALGTFAGVAYVTYRAATNPQEIYGTSNLHDPVPQSEREPLDSRWQAAKNEPTDVGFTFTF